MEEFVINRRRSPHHGRKVIRTHLKEINYKEEQWKKTQISL